MAILKKKQSHPTGDHPKGEKKEVVARKTSVAHVVDDVLLRPVLSEKTTGQEAQSQYTFVVERGATKDAIKQAFRQIYGIKPKRVNVIHTDGRNVRFGRFKGKRSAVKKAIISLPKGQKIEIHEGV